MPTSTAPTNTTIGIRPEAGLIEDADGDLFGTTAQGGADGEGTVFEIAKTADGYASTPIILSSFTGPTGTAPRLAALLVDSAGDLVGSASEAGAADWGTVFEVAKTTDGYASAPVALANFNGANGAFPESGLIADAAGDLFGTTIDGGLNWYPLSDAGEGTVFEIVRTSDGYDPTPTTLVAFNGDDGANPFAGLIADAAGDLFGTTSAGGAGNAGTVFEIAKLPSGYANTPDTLVSFNGADGAGPLGGLIADAAGNLFGATAGGGANGDGTIFEIAKTDAGYAGAPAILASFDGTDGNSPQAALVADPAGDLFGTTYSGGAEGDGTVFEIAKTSTGYASSPETLVGFTGADGANPIAGLTIDGAGNLFGTTAFGGAGSVEGDGTVFEIPRTSSGYASAPITLVNFGEAMCFLPGTLLLTPAGEVAVEQLAVGDLVLTHRGEARPIVWIGMGHMAAIPGHRSGATPVIIRKGAFADNVPNRDLHVTKGHSFFLNNILVPVEFLINYRSIRRDDHARDVTLYHVELETHDVLLANGAPAESYRDDGNRRLFGNANTGWGLPAKPPCAPVLTGGAVVDAIWRRLLDRAGSRDPVPTTDHPDLHLLVDGTRLDGQSRALGVHLFHLPRAPTELRVMSRSAAPAELGLARDPRCLGVAVRRVSLWQGPRLRTIEALDLCIEDGFHRFEPDNGFRWTNGDARLPPALFNGVRGGELELHIGGTARYRTCAQGVPVEAA